MKILKKMLNKTKKKTTWILLMSTTLKEIKNTEKL